MPFPIQRLRRLRETEPLRRMVRETSLTPNDFIYPVFVTNGKDVIGILTDTDMVRRVVATGADMTKTTVEQIMSAPLVTIEEHKTLLDANDLMAQTHLRHLGVTKDGQLVGMISVRDLVVFLTNLPRK
jgi:CBS domain-containing protein